MTMTTEQTPIDNLEALAKEWYAKTYPLTLATSIRAFCEEDAIMCADFARYIRSLPTPESAEPVAWMNPAGFEIVTNDKMEIWKISAPHARDRFTVPLYAHPPKPEQPRVVLTDEEIEKEVHRLWNASPAVWRIYLEECKEDGNWKATMEEGIRYARDHYGIGAPAGFTPSEPVTGCE